MTHVQLIKYIVVPIYLEVHIPLSTSAAGRYIRKITLNEFLSDGSQLDSLSFPGLSPSVLVFNPGDASVLLYVTIKIQKIK
jgi:hypothetical protein